MNDVVVDGAGVVVIRVAVPVKRTAVGLARRNAVAEHFEHIFQRHLHAAHPRAVRRVVDPVFQMMAVSSLVVQPRRTVSLFAPLDFVRAAVALIIPRTRPELDRTEFAEVVRESLTVKTDAPAVPQNQKTVMLHRAQMLKPFQNQVLLRRFRLIVFYHRKRKKKRGGTPCIPVHRRAPCTNFFA